MAWIGGEVTALFPMALGHSDPEFYLAPVLVSRLLSLLLSHQGLKESACSLRRHLTGVSSLGLGAGRFVVARGGVGGGMPSDSILLCHC